MVLSAESITVFEQKLVVHHGNETLSLCSHSVHNTGHHFNDGGALKGRVFFTKARISLRLVDSQLALLSLMDSVLALLQRLEPVGSKETREFSFNQKGNDSHQTLVFDKRPERAL